MNSRTTDTYSIHSGATLDSLSSIDDDCDERSCYSTYTIETDATLDSCSIYTKETIEVTYIPIDCEEYFRMQVMCMMKKHGCNGNVDLYIEQFQLYLIDVKRSTSYFDSYVKYPIGRKKLLGLFRTYMDGEILEATTRNDCIQGVVQRDTSKNEEDPILGRNIVVYDIFQESASIDDMDKLSYAAMFDTTGLKPKLIPDIIQVKESTLDASKKCTVVTPLSMGINIAAEKFILSLPNQKDI